jgi:DNA/RNA endonuclease YhcR with UshA esterase domain
MKRAAALLLALLMVLSLCACAAEETPKQTEDTNSTKPSTSVTDPSNDPTTPSNDPSAPSDDPSTPSQPSDEINVITIAEALELCGESGNVTTERYYLRGVIVAIKNANYGQMTIQDATGSIDVYGTYSADGSINYSEMAEKPYKGDEVLLHCILQNYNGTKEVKNARLISFVVNEQEIDESAYTAGSIADARKAKTGAKMKVDGVVAQITYANGRIPSGVYLVDETNSIYVYDSELAARVKIGNKITILAEKDYWILGDEQHNADKFGYKGCNQLTSAILVDNDNGTNDFDKSWIPTSTVKQIMDTPVTKDITTTIYKVNALVSKVPGNGFVNYYINDLDGETGSYVYTQCNGSDFGWLDAFDGKICTVYLSVINAKSTASGCNFRFLPVMVVDEKFNTSSVNPAEFAVIYKGLEQFDASYTGNPELELITSVSSDLLGFKDVKLTYSSSDSSVISIDNNVMNCKKTGTATITVTGTYGSKTYSKTVKISVTITEVADDYDTVFDAIAASVGDTVTV